MNGARATRALGRLAGVLACILLGFVLLEAVLQVGAACVRWTGREPPTGWLTRNRRVLCLGDSNTYGLYVGSDESYPRRLEALSAASGEGGRLEVLNLGFPGTNTSRLRRDLPRILDVFHPDTVVMMVGANDFWTVPVPPDPAEDTRGPVRRFVARYSRVYRMLHALRRLFDTARLEVSLDLRPSADEGAGQARYGREQFALGWQRNRVDRRNPETLRELGAVLRTMVLQVREGGATPVLLTYPSRRSAYGAANTAIVDAARATHTPLVDVARVFAAACPTQDCPELFYPDDHPTARGYRLVAEVLFAHLTGGPAAPPARGAP